MKLTSDQIIDNSFVVTIDNKRYSAFEKEFKNAGFEHLPKKFVGYEITDKYLIDNFKIIADLQFSIIRGVLEQNLRLIHSICNNASHFAIVQHAQILDLPFVTIFEDDAVPVCDCIEKLRFYCSDIPDDTDVLRLGYLYSSDPADKNYYNESNVVGNFIVQRFPGSHAYVVFKKYYQRFLDDNKDLPRCDYSKINPTPDKVVYALRESVFDQLNIEDAPVIHSYKLKNGREKLPPVK